MDEPTRQARATLIGCLLIPIIVALGFSLVFLLPSKLHKDRVNAVRPGLLQDTMRRAVPLIAAIRRYENENGKPPEELSALVPKYLDTPPYPGDLAKDGWRYEAGRRPDDGGWTLWVRSHKHRTGLYGFSDAFVYHPSGKYEMYDYGGVLERISDWAYYHE